jgi:hypothetical protein
VRAFGYFNPQLGINQSSDVAISQRTINETAAIAEYLSRVTH